MFPEDYFDDISLLAVYGYPNAYKIYSKIDSTIENQSLYINVKESFQNSTLIENSREHCHIGITCCKENLVEFTCGLKHQNINYYFIVDGYVENKSKIITKLEEKGYILNNYSHTYLFALMFLKAQGTIQDKITYVTKKLKGSYNYAVLYNDNLILGTYNKINKRLNVLKTDTGAFIISDNYDYLTQFNGTVIKEIEEGESILIYDNQITLFLSDNKKSICALSYCYKTNMSSKINQINLFDIKLQMLKYLEDTKADIITHYPGDPVTYALEYANNYNHQYKEISCIYNNNLLFIDKYIKDQHITIIKENISHIEAIKRYIDELYRRGAKQVDLKVMYPMINYDCIYSLRKNNKTMLFNEMGIKEYLNITQLEFISDVNLMNAIRKFDSSTICLKCINKI